MSPKDIFTIVESLNCEFISLKLNLTSFASILTYIFMSGSGPGKLLNTDPDPQHCMAGTVTECRHWTDQLEEDFWIFC